MTRQRNAKTPAEARAAMFKFLDEFDNRTLPDEVACLHGHLCQLRESGNLDHADLRAWRKAVSLAVTAH